MLLTPCLSNRIGASAQRMSLVDMDVTNRGPEGLVFEFLYTLPSRHVLMKFLNTASKKLGVMRVSYAAMDAFRRMRPNVSITNAPLTGPIADIAHTLQQFLIDVFEKNDVLEWTNSNEIKSSASVGAVAVGTTAVGAVAAGRHDVAAASAGTNAAAAAITMQAVNNKAHDAHKGLETGTSAPVTFTPPAYSAPVPITTFSSSFSPNVETTQVVTFPTFVPSPRASCFGKPPASRA